MSYQHSPATCPICKGKEKPALSIGVSTCNLCGNSSAKPEGGYRFMVIDTDNGNKHVGYTTAA
jgi:ribosomal protein L37AE/L43A